MDHGLYQTLALAALAGFLVAGAMVLGRRADKPLQQALAGSHKSPGRPQTCPSPLAGEGVLRSKTDEGSGTLSDLPSAGVGKPISNDHRPLIRPAGAGHLLPQGEKDESSGPLGHGGSASRWAWLAPAALSAALLAWSALTVAREGPIGFWPHHLSDAWGLQIWFDLLLGIGSAFALLVPRARAVGMRPAPWLVVIACTGSIGLLAMLSRYLFLAQAQGAARHPS